MHLWRGRLSPTASPCGWETSSISTALWRAPRWTSFSRDPRSASPLRASQAAQDDFTTYFQSACVEGEASEVLDQEEKIRALRALCEKLTPAPGRK